MSTGITYQAAIRQERRNAETYFNQLVNILFGLCRVTGQWLVMTVVYSCVAGLLFFVTTDASALAQSELYELQALAGFVVAICAVCAGLPCLTCNVGQFRNVFAANAVDQVERFEAIKKKVRSQTETTEGLLLRYGLITEADVEKRKAEQSL